MKSGIRNILFVCTGNTCRSAMAAAVFNKMAIEKELCVKAVSAGLFADVEQPASKNAVIACAGIAVDLKNHFARQITDEIIAENDLIVPLSNSHKRVLLKNYKVEEEKIFKSGMDIPDPYMGSLEDYKQCLTEIIKLCEKVMNILL